jgi:methyl-accepting chemotaxis protein
MKNLPITGKFLIALGMMAVMAIGVSLYAMTGLSQTASQYDELLTHQAQGVLFLARANRAAADIGRLAYKVIAETDDLEMQKAAKDWVDAKAYFIGQMVGAGKAMPELRLKLDEIIGKYNLMLPGLEEVVALGLKNDNAVAVQLMGTKVEPLMVDFREQIASFVSERNKAFAADSDAIKTAASTTGSLIVAVAVAGSLLALLVAFWIARTGVSTPILGLVERMERLAKDDASIIVEGQDRGDEIGAIARCLVVFKDAALAKRDLEAAQRQEQALKEARQRRIEGHIATFDQAAQESLKTLRSASDDLNATASSMSATAEETSRQASAVAVASEQATTNVQAVAGATEELSASISEIGRHVVKSTAIAGQAVEEASRTNATVQGLADAAQKIGEVVQLINNIASQTNLLALNATIEAARDGEAGKGFAVVASEVKNLANQTARATGEISTQIASVQGVAGDTVQAIQKISATISEMNEIATTIAAAVEQQSAATAEISRNVQQAAQGTTEVSRNIVGVNRAAGDTGAASSQVLGSASGLGHQAEIMRVQVETFLSDIRAA